MNATRKLYVHCGLHKTGTTSLQGALRFNETALRELGFLYPHAGCLDTNGRKTPGQRGAVHRNLAWQLAGSRTFRQARGDLGMLASEIADFPGSVIISCEGFESLLDRPQALLPLQTLATAGGRELNLVIYLRNQIEYCESLYYQLLPKGAGKTFDQYVTSILESGKVRRSDSVYHFDYEAILTGLDRQFHGNILVRNYHDVIGNSVVTDFPACVGIDTSLADHPDEKRRNRRSDATDALRQFIFNRLGRDQTLEQTIRTRLVADNLRKPKMSARRRNLFAERFFEGNRRICRKFGLSEIGLTEATAQSSQPDRPSFGEAFSFETQCFIETGQVPEFVPSAERMKNNEWLLDLCERSLHITLGDQLRHSKRRLKRLLLRR